MLGHLLFMLGVVVLSIAMAIPMMIDVEDKKSFYEDVAKLYKGAKYAKDHNSTVDLNDFPGMPQ